MKILFNKLILSGLILTILIFGLALSIDDFQLNNFFKTQFHEKSIANASMKKFVSYNVNLDKISEPNHSNQFESKSISAALIQNSEKVITINNTNCNCVAFRLDDIQDHWLTDSQIEIMEVFNERELPLTIGIIGNRIGDDEIIVSYIQQRIPSELLEIANHGWNHEHFKEYNLTTQKSFIKYTTEKIQKIFQITPTVFIPPYNEFNDDTISAMNYNNITYFSSSISQSKYPYHVNSYLHNFPAAASTGKQTYKGSLIEGVTHDITIYDLHKSISELGFAVVMLHPQEFSIIENGKYSEHVNWKQIMDLELLLDQIQSEGIEIVLISDIDSKL